mgnify:CR=1 FL=1
MAATASWQERAAAPRGPVYDGAGGGRGGGAYLPEPKGIGPNRGRDALAIPWSW